MTSTEPITVRSRSVAPTTDGPEPGSSRPMRKDAARNRELLLDAARVVFAQRGMEASLDDVARQAGLGVGTAYRHFANKYELLSALMAQMVASFLATAERTLTIEDPWLGLVTFVEQALEAQVDDRGLREVMLGFHDPATFEELHERISAVLDQLIDRARAAGVIREEARSSDIGVIITMLCAAADLTGEQSPQLWRRYLALCLEGLRPGRPPLPEAALTTSQLRDAMAAHKLSTHRPG